MNIHLELHIDEVNAVLTLLGQMPTQTNVWPLCAKVRQQAEMQVQAAQQQEPHDAGERNPTN